MDRKHTITTSDFLQFLVFSILLAFTISISPEDVIQLDKIAVRTTVCPEPVSAILKPRIHSYKAVLIHEVLQPRRGYTLQKFSLQTCNKTAPLQGTASVAPDPIKIPGNVTVEFKGSVGVTVKSPTKTIVKVEKKVLDVWVNIPCVDNLGSCTYDDGCAMIPFTAGDPCPPPLSTYNIPCTCPFPQGTYRLPSSTVEIPDEHLPEFLTDGDHKVNVKLYDTQNDQLACFDAAFSLTA